MQMKWRFYSQGSASNKSGRDVAAFFAGGGKTSPRDSGMENVVVRYKTEFGHWANRESNSTQLIATSLSRGHKFIVIYVPLRDTVESQSCISHVVAKKDL